MRQRLKGRIGGALSVWFESRREAARAVSFRPDAALCFALQPWQLAPVLHVLRRSRVPVFQEYNEYPYVLVRNQIEAFLAWYFVKHQICRFSGLALMTRHLETFFQTHTSRCPATAVIPMTVEPERFDDPGTPPFPFPYIGYCGKLDGDKDGVPILLNAFALIASEFPDVKLVLIGDDRNRQTGDLLRGEMDRLGLSGRVIFTGLIPREKMPEYLCNARVLALARPPTLQAEGGFPTKLGEYLATGRPVAVTRVGEIGDYLVDGANAYLAEPGDPSAFAQALRRPLSNAKNAAEVGSRGREVALTVFNYQVQGARLAEFMEETLRAKRSAEGGK
jgi:glycosyltransferase involved in cell wall biosynthesis